MTNHVDDKTIEPKFEIRTNWKNMIDLRYGKELMVQDNNLTAAPFSHQEKVIEHLRTIDKAIDFGSGLDCRLFKNRHARLYSQLTNLKALRFAFDSMESDGYFQRAMEHALRHFKTTNRSFFPTYMLYNCEETIDEIWYRIKAIHEAGALPYPMCFAPLTDMDREHVGTHWTKHRKLAFKALIRKHSQGRMILGENFLPILGESPDEFKENLDKAETTEREGRHRVRMQHWEEGGVSEALDKLKGVHS